MKTPRAFKSPKLQAARKWLNVWSPYMPGAFLFVLGMVVLTCPESFRIAVGFFFLALGILIIQITRMARRMFKGLQAHVEVYSEDEPEESSAAEIFTEPIRQWVN